MRSGKLTLVSGGGGALPARVLLLSCSFAGSGSGQRRAGAKEAPEGARVAAAQTLSCPCKATSDGAVSQGESH